MPTDSETNTKADFDREFQRMITNQYPFLLNFARTLCGRQDGEDYAQEACARAWRSRATFREGSNFKAWLCTILRNRIISDKRRDWRRVPMSDARLATLITGWNEAEQTVLLKQVKALIDQLPLPQRNALLLVGKFGASYDEAAQVTNAPIGTLKSRVARARATVSQRLEKQQVRAA